MVKENTWQAFGRRIKKYTGLGMAGVGAAIGGWIGTTQYAEHEIDNLPFYLRWPTKIYTSLMSDDAFMHYNEVAEHPFLYGGIAAGLLATGLSIYLKNKNPEGHALRMEVLEEAKNSLNSNTDWEGEAPSLTQEDLLAQLEIYLKQLNQQEGLRQQEPALALG